MIYQVKRLLLTVNIFLRMKTLVKPFNCSHCGEIFQHKNTMKHARMHNTKSCMNHNDLKPFKCAGDGGIFEYFRIYYEETCTNTRMNYNCMLISTNQYSNMVRNFKVTTVWTLEYHLNVHFGAGSGLLCYQTFSHIWNNWMVFPFFAPFHGFLVRLNPQKPCHIESSWMAVHMNDRFHGSLVLLSSQKPCHI